MSNKDTSMIHFLNVTSGSYNLIMNFVYIPLIPRINKTKELMTYDLPVCIL